MSLLYVGMFLVNHIKCVDLAFDPFSRRRKRFITLIEVHPSLHVDICHRRENARLKQFFVVRA
jgi:hypothetical protein